MVKHYYGPLCCIYCIITTELPDISKEMALQMAFKTINDFAGPDSLIPTLLIFGTVIRSVPIEAYSLVGIVERYYGPLYCIYHIITIKLLDISKDIAL